MCAEGGAGREALRRFAGFAGSCVFLFAIAGPSRGAWFEGAGTLFPGGTSELRGVSADGSVAAGQATGEDGFDHVILYLPGGVLVDLGIPPGFDFGRARAVAVDPEGGVHVAGYGLHPPSGANRGFYWSGDSDGNGEYFLLPTFGGTESIARALRVTADGDVRIVGYAKNAAGKVQAFRWRRSDGDLLNLDDWLSSDDANSRSDAWGISRGGGKISGFAQAGGDFAFHFTTAGNQGMWNFAPGRGRGISADGDWVVGERAGASADQAFRWFWNGGMGSPLELLGPGAAYAVAEGGTVVAGSGPQGAMIWDAEGGWRPLQEELTEVYGLDLSGWELETAWAVSDDGLTIAGTGTHNGVTEGWIAHLGGEAAPRFVRSDANADATSDIADAIFLLSHLFTGGPAPSCPDAADSNDDGTLDISDAVYLLNYLFVGGAPPPPPLEECGEDPTPDDLGDCLFEPCA